MSKTLSFRGKLDIGVQQKIKLSTLKGKTGYRITNFKVLSSTPGVTNIETVVKIYSKSQTNFPATVDFTESDLLAVAYYQDDANQAYPSSVDITFDNEVFNQDIFIYAEDAAGGSVPFNFYIEIETIRLSDIQATQLTLKSLRNLASR